MGLISQPIANCLENFATQLKQGLIDLRVIALHTPSFCAGPTLTNGVPCPGENPPAYYPIAVSIGETNSLQVLLDNYTSFEKNLRPDAEAKVLVVVSDNNSSVSASSFLSSWLGKKDGGPNSGWIYAALVTQSTCAGSAGGSEYMSLSSTNGGILGDLCTAFQSPSPDPDGFAAKLATTIKAMPGIGCSWEIPTSPPGHDKKLVTVASGTNTLNYKATSASCASDTAWYFDDPQAPTRIMACPGLCSEVKKKALPSKISVTFLCP